MDFYCNYRIDCPIVTLHDSHADQIQIPLWVKNTAKWWSQGQISDHDFVKGVQYLIQQRIMQVTTQQGQSTVPGQIPTWVKNNAGWWANGTIGDEDFVKGIQYLVQVNIINVNSQKFSCSLVLPLTTTILFHPCILVIVIISPHL